jgi:hypothetical protein
MKLPRACWLILVAGALGIPGWATATESGALKVHLAQANNDSLYAFVRAKFRPGEVTDPWAVRFFDEKGTEVPYFVWDSVTWKVAKEGREDWGHRYALINHGPGNEPEVAVTGDKVTLKVSQSAKLRLDYGILRPDWAAKDKPILHRR